MDWAPDSWGLFWWVALYEQVELFPESSLALTGSGIDGRVDTESSVGALDEDGDPVVLSILDPSEARYLQEVDNGSSGY